ncbi:MAG: hypothetical protein A2860_01955 [Candidatus Levybacteria bacterium RIFCSPHIGHO2_01_FULL_37_33]|nr:MAG: hypothetical protein A2860_01955 [Candidatus Levybacteria bacterium RIFCSPHIGHO2_01_FULL_37_33]OGH32630.1 MAG: hypothetical protein A2953_01210 [Candidatus Levybacteria bacterium RIFCSPLOWO2_01_FULL_36_54]
MKTKYKLLAVAGFSALTIALLSIFLYLSFQSFNLAIEYFMVGLIVTFVLNAVAAILLLSNSTSGQIARLHEGTKAIAQGNLDYKVGIQTRDDLGQLPGYFDERTEKLKASYFEDLEEKVSEKNKALMQRIEELDSEQQKNKEAEEKTLIEKTKDEATLTSIGEGVVVTDPQGKILVFNHAAEQMTNWIASEAVGRFWFETVPAMDEKGYLISREDRDMYKALTTGKKVFSQSIYLQKGSGKITVAITATPIVLKDQIIGAVQVFRDISHEKEVDRMKTEFISLASHQLRTPLSAVKWFCEMLLNGDAGELNPEQKEYAKNVSDSNERMISLVNSLLNISRIESGRIIVDPKPTNINKLISEVITEIKVKSNAKKQQIIVSVHSDLPLINIDPQLIREVYVNLLTNASKYTPPGGEISVFISKKGDELISQVSDNGYGIPKKDCDKIFQKFYRGENIIKIETEGNGLGLYLAKAIVESSGGKIWFSSSSGSQPKADAPLEHVLGGESTEEKDLPAEREGTSFYFSLPISGVQAKKGEVTLNS